METLDRLYPVSLLFAAGYLLATRRRSRRAAVMGLIGVALVSIWVVLFLLGSDHGQALATAGWSDAASRRMVVIWLPRIELALAYGLLIAAALVDRRPVSETEG